MGDDWDDEDFEVPTIIDVSKPAAAAAPMWDDEEEEQQEEQNIPAAPSAAQIAAAEKKREQEAITMANKMKFAAEANETPEQRKQREKLAAEEADIAASADLFGSAASGPSRVTSGVASLSISRASSSVTDAPLKNIKDHQQYASTICAKFTASSSTPFNIGAFYTKLTNELKGKLPVESLQDAIEALQNEMEEKKGPVKKGPVKKSKAQIKVEKKKHEETFGGDDYEDKYSHYSNIEDDFM